MPAADAHTGDAGLATDEQQALHPALSIALQHPIIACDPDPRMVCSLLQVSKTWRTAVQRTNACSVVISNAPEYYQLRPPRASVPVTALRDAASLSCLAGWLFNHASLVAEMWLYEPDTDEVGEVEDDYADKAYPIMLRCLQQAAAAALPAAAGQAASALSSGTAPPAAGAATSPEAAAAGAAVCAAFISPAAPQPLLRLRSFSSNYLRSPAILAALPATLTRLQVEEDCDHSFDPAACAAALGRLTNLRELDLPDVDLEAPFVEALAKLPHLTKLSAAINCSYRTAMHLPQQLVEVGTLCISIDDETVSCLDFTHIKDLLSLRLLMLHPPVDPSSLPTKLTALTLVNRVDRGGHGVPCVTAFQVTALQQLQQLKVCYPSGCVDRPPQLQLLAQLQQLQSLELEYASCSDALSAAPAWCHLPCLKGLELVGHEVDEGLQTADVQQVLRGVAACTGLTKLTLSWKHVPDDASAEVCSQLKGLKNLASLRLWCLKPTPKDLVHLRELTSLTGLHFYRCPTVDDYAAVTLACALATCSARSRLESLTICQGGLRSPAALPAIAMLTGLKQLDLSCNPGAFTDESLMHLTTLTRLTELASSGQFSAAAIAALYAAIESGPLQQQRQQPEGGEAATAFPL